jgi:hypothetical protein
MDITIDSERVRKYGANGAIVFEVIAHRIMHGDRNAAVAGKVWAPLGEEEIADASQSLTRKQVRLARNRLEKDRAILVRKELGDSKWQRTKWYAIGEEGSSEQ